MSRHKAVEEELRTKTLDFTAEVATLENSLDDQRASGNDFREEIERHKRVRKEFEETIDVMKKQASDHMQARDDLNIKVDDLRDQIASLGANHAADRSAWQGKDEELAKKHEVMNVRLDEELRVKDNLEAEILRLTEREKEAVRLQVAMEEMSHAKRGLDATLSAMERESVDNQSVIARLEREVNNARENTAAEVQRNKTKLEAEIEVANQRAEQVRSESESRIKIFKDKVRQAREETASAKEITAAEVQRTKTRLEGELEAANQRTEQIRAELQSRLKMVNAELEHLQKQGTSANDKHDSYLRETKESYDSYIHETKDKHDAHIRETKEKHDAALREVNQNHDKALREANKSSSAALSEAKTHFVESSRELSEQHAKALENATADKKRTEEHMQGLLDISKAQNEHLLEKVKNLEELVTISQSAAQAAAAAAQSAKSRSPTRTTFRVPVGAASAPEGFEKVSPQALRESILALQEQLQDRELRVEQLEQEASQVDRTLPDKLRARETEVTWLRELFAVRLDDLSDLVNTLEGEDFDHTAIRNTAIRIRASLQMEQHAKERLIAGDANNLTASIAALTTNGAAAVLPTLTDIQNFASPKAAQLAAAWGNWRKGRESPTLASLRESINSDSPSRRPLAGLSRHKPTGSSASAEDVTADNFMSGLMTPPASDLRKTPSSSTATTRPLSGARPRTPSISSRPNSAGGGSVLEPDTPPLLRKAAYDFDAEIGPEGPSEYEEATAIEATRFGGLTQLQPVDEEEGHVEET